MSTYGIALSIFYILVIVYLMIILPFFFLLSVRKHVGLRRVFRQWFSSFKHDKRDAIMGSMVVHVLIGFLAYGSLTLVFFAFFPYHAGILEVIPTEEARLLLSMLACGILVPLFVGMFIHNTQGMIVGAYSPLLFTVPYAITKSFPSSRVFNILFGINIASYLIGWAATGVFHPKRRIGYFLSHFKILKGNSDVLDIPRIKGEIATICRTVYGERMVESIRETMKDHVAKSGVTYLGNYDFEFHHSYNSNLDEIKNLLELASRNPTETYWTKTLFEIPFILHPSHLVRIGDILPNVHKGDYFLKDGCLYRVRNVEKDTLKASNLSADSCQLTTFTGDQFIVSLEVTATNSLNTFFYTLGKLVTRITFTINEKGTHILIYSYEDSPGLRWPTFRLSIIANKIHRDVQEMLKNHT